MQIGPLHLEPIVFDYIPACIATMISNAYAIFAVSIHESDYLRHFSFVNLSFFSFTANLLIFLSFNYYFPVALSYMCIFQILNAILLKIYIRAYLGVSLQIGLSWRLSGCPQQSGKVLTFNARRPGDFVVGKRLTQLDLVLFR